MSKKYIAVLDTDIFTLYIVGNIYICITYCIQEIVQLLERLNPSAKIIVPEPRFKDLDLEDVMLGQQAFSLKPP